MCNTNLKMQLNLLASKGVLIFIYICVLKNEFRVKDY